MIRSALAAAFVALALPAAAQERIPSHCHAFAATPGVEYLHRASLTTPIAADHIRLHYVYHSMFWLATPGGISVATDYTGSLGATDHVPTVVTMNNAHSTHWTGSPDPRISHVLPGWADEDGPMDHYLDLGEMLVRNVPTDVRSGMGGVRPAGNSIFVFEVAGLCIGHLGHLHHEPSDEQYIALGRMDVVMAPVDGGMTLNLPTMIATLKRLRAQVVIPMHWFGQGSLDRFLAGMSDDFAIDRTGGSAIDLSLHTLPPRPTVVVLNPSFLND
jgi:hypothetical protein